MITLSQVNKFFGEKKALDRVSFQIKRGEIIGFVGPNGAGKTTTMRVIVGYLKASSGQVLVDGKDPIDQRVEILRMIGYLPENNPLYSEMKVNEYLRFIGEVKDDQNNLEKLKTQIGLTEVWEKKIEELSRGYKQRVGLAAALLGDPKILILDEPTSGLDPIEQEKIRELIKKLGKEKTIILSTHILSEVEEVATRVIIINQGKIVFDGPRPRGKGAVEKLFKKLIKR